MDVLFVLAYLIIFAAFGFINYRTNRQKAAELVDEIKRFNN